MLVAPPVAGYSERVYQVFGKETLDQLIAVAAVQNLEHVGLAAASAVAAGRSGRRTRKPAGTPALLRARCGCMGLFQSRRFRS